MSLILLIGKYYESGQPVAKGQVPLRATKPTIRSRRQRAHSQTLLKSARKCRSIALFTCRVLPATRIPSRSGLHKAVRGRTTSGREAYPWLPHSSLPAFGKQDKFSIGLLAWRSGTAWCPWWTVEDFDPTGVCRRCCHYSASDRRVKSSWASKSTAWTERLHLPGTGELSE
jgi:hypothetical protein